MQPLPLLRAALSLLPLITLLMTPTAIAADDPSIQGDLREKISQTLSDYIEGQTLEGRMLHYDPVAGKLLTLNLEKLHEGIVRKGDYYVSCADFEDQEGRSLDLDFLVRVASDGSLRATQAIVHKVEGKKRPYDLEGTAASDATHSH